MSVLLNREEIREITGLWQHCAQARALTRLGIPFERRSTNGSVIVGREAATRALCKNKERQQEYSSAEPVWSVNP